MAAYVIDGLLLGTVQLTLLTLVQMIAPHDLQAMANLLPVGIVLAWAYFSLFECSPMQATIGKLALDICVTDRNGDPIDFRRASIRFWAKLLSSLVLMLGWLMAAFTPERRALHDFLAGTLVLRRATVLVTPPLDHPSAALGEHWDGLPGQDPAWSSTNGRCEQRPPTLAPGRFAQTLGRMSERHRMPCCLSSTCWGA